MILHIFNPEHDIALASNLAHFTAPHAGRQLRADLCFLPALWASSGDAILVDDASYAAKAYHRFTGATKLVKKDVKWVTRHDLVQLELASIEPWGWDAALRHSLVRYGIPLSQLPTLDEIDEIRWLSHRARIIEIQKQLVDGEQFIGESVYSHNLDEIEEKLQQYRQIVLKAPWSSSGRGVRFVQGALTVSQQGWLNNLLKLQGGVMVEPYYNKVKDLGMEFESDAKGHVRFCGLSLFHTANGAYTGNVLATEAAKMELLSHYVSKELIEHTKEKLCSLTGALFNGRYQGPFGVDMMICASQDKHRGMANKKGFLLHPCVEINLRRTMGHVALSVSPDSDDVKKVMRITMEGSNYKLRIRKL